MRLPVMTHKKVNAMCAVLLVLNVAGCQGGAVSSQSTREQAREHSRLEATPPPSPTPVEQDTPTQEEIAEEAAREGYRIHRGRYTNQEYGFSVVIPEGYVGVKDPEPNPAHGFWIVLSRRPKATINVYGNYDAANYTSLDEAVDAQLRYVKSDGTGIEVLSREPMKLQSLPATRVVARYRDPASGATMIQDLITSFRWQRYDGEEEPWVLYILFLRTPESRYNADKEVFDRVVSAWRATPLES